MTSIAVTLGIGSGIDTSALVAQLVAAQKAPRETAITARETANKAKVSALADLASGIDGFTTALQSLISGGSLFTQPNSSNASAVGATALAGSRIADLSASVEVSQLAQAQTLVSGNVASATAAIGQGTMTLTTARGATTITIGPDNDSLTGLAKAINDANTSVTASVITDSAGARLVLKGVVGASNAYTLTADSGAAAGLSAFTYDPQGTSAMTLAQGAQDAMLKLDGVSVTRSSNTISDLIAGVKLELKNTTTSTGAVAITSTQPVANMRQAVIDYVDTYNALKTKLDADLASGADGTTAGALAGDPGARTMQQLLARLTSQTLASGTTVSSLSQIGVTTGTNGQLTVNTSKLDAALTASPNDIEAMFNPTQSASSPLVTITSAMGKTKPGSYALTDIVMGPPMSGKVNGVAMTAIGNKLVATAASGAIGLVIQPSGDVASATITVEAGLGGALQTVRDTLRDSTSGVLTNSTTRLTTEATAIADDREKMETRSTTYEAQLTKQFTAMDTRVAAYKATQSYLEQQIKIWTNSDS